MQGTLSFAAGSIVTFGLDRKMPRRAVVCGAFVERKRRAASLYEVLKVEEDASLREIKAAYRTLAKVYHPDASAAMGGKEFMEINLAYLKLSDPEKRAEYDRRRTPIRYQSSQDYSSPRRWETDQCW